MSTDLSLGVRNLQQVCIGTTTKLSDSLTHPVEVKVNRAQPATQHNTQSANTIDGQSEITVSAKLTHGTLQLTWTNKVRHAVGRWNSDEVWCFTHSSPERPWLPSGLDLSHWLGDLSVVTTVSAIAERTIAIFEDDEVVGL